MNLPPNHQVETDERGALWRNGLSSDRYLEVLEHEVEFLEDEVRYWKRKARQFQEHEHGGSAMQSNMTIPVNIPANAQGRKGLLQLPPELRIKIWRLVIPTNVIVVSNPIRSGATAMRGHEQMQAVARLQRTCKTIRNDIVAEASWTLAIRLQFGTLEAMLNELSCWPRKKLSLIKALKVPMTPLWLRKGRQEDPRLTSFLRLPDVLELLPGLRVDELIVDATGTHVNPFRAILHMAIASNGWKRAIFLFPHDGFLDVPCDPHNVPKTSPPQPKNWDRAIKKRDGKDSGASVRLFQEVEPGSGPELLLQASPSLLTLNGLELLSTQRQTVDRSVQLTRFHHLQRDHNSTAVKRDGTWRRVVVVLQRGERSDYVQRMAERPFHAHNIRSKIGNLDWSQLKTKLMPPLGSDIQWPPF